MTLSPHLDALAAGGVKLERHYVQRWCAPTRATLLSGRYAFNTGFNEYMPVEQRAALPFAYAALPQLLKDAGWRTHMLGKVRVHSMSRSVRCAAADVGSLACETAADCGCRRESRLLTPPDLFATLVRSGTWECSPRATPPLGEGSTARTASSSARLITWIVARRSRTSAHVGQEGGSGTELTVHYLSAFLRRETVEVITMVEWRLVSQQLRHCQIVQHRTAALGTGRRNVAPVQPIA